MALDSETRRMIALPRNEVEWFEQNYGEGRLSWVLSLLLIEFHKYHSLTPADYAALGARELAEKINDV